MRLDADERMDGKVKKVRPIGKPTIPFQKVDITRLTNNRNIGLSEISPDGKYIVYVDREKGHSSLWLRTANISFVLVAAGPSTSCWSAISATGKIVGGTTFGGYTKSAMTWPWISVSRSSRPRWR